MNKITAQVGQVVEVNGKQYRATESGFDPVESKRGPLGGEVIEAKDLHIKQVAYFRAHRQTGLAVDGLHKAIKFEGVSGYIPIPGEAICETNIPPRPAFTPMTAGEAARLPDVVGRWVAVKVEDIDDEYLYVATDSPYSRSDQILLIEGVDL